MKICIDLKETDLEKTVQAVLHSRFCLSNKAYKHLKWNSRIYCGCFQVHLTDRIFKTGPLVLQLPDSEPIPITDFSRDGLLYEDEYLLIVNKPAGIQIHKSSLSPAPALADLWARRTGKKLYAFGRLDRETSGVMIFARHPFIHSLLEEQKKRKQWQKTYLAIASGSFSKKEGIIQKPIGPDPHQFNRFQIDEKGLPALSRYQVLQEKDSLSLVQLNLDTGRTHQIRVHLSSLGRPLLGDQFYNPKAAAGQRALLHAWKLEGIHPIFQTPVKIQADPPEDFSSLFPL